jgi:predicted porin
MKKSLIALAVLASSGAAMAQSTVTLFGTLDPGVWNQKTTLGNGASSSQTLLGNNGRGTTQVSVKGVAEISAGLNGIFLYEGDMTPGSSSGVAAAGTSSGQHPIGSGGGEVFGGLQGGFGSIKLGSPNTPTLNSQASRQPMGTKIGGGFNTGSLGIAHVRNNNSLAYATNDLGGVTVSGAYAFKSVTGQPVGGITTTADIGSILDLGVDAVFGPAKFGLTQYSQKKITGQVSDHNQTNVYGQFAVATSTVYAGFVNQKDTAGNKATGLNLAVKVGLGDLSLLANVAKLNDKSTANNDKTTTAIGADYALGKRTTLYTRLSVDKTSNLASTSTSVAKLNSFVIGTQVNF